jgi:hypothetical protein
MPSRYLLRCLRLDDRVGLVERRGIPRRGVELDTEVDRDPLGSFARRDGHAPEPGHQGGLRLSIGLLDLGGLQGPRQELTGGRANGLPVVRVVIDAPLDGLALGLLDLDLEEAASGGHVAAGAGLVAGPTIMDMVAEAPKLGRIEVRALVLEDPRAVYLQHVVVIAQRVHHRAQPVERHQVLVVLASLQRRALVDGLQRSRQQPTHEVLDIHHECLTRTAAGRCLARHRPVAV